jgi:hypothetical protein
MSRCPICGYRVAGGARRYEEFVCPRCDATLRCTVRATVAPLAIGLILFVFLLALTATVGVGIFPWFIFAIIFAACAGSPRVEVVRRRISTTSERSDYREPQAGPTRSVSSGESAKMGRGVARDDRSWRYCIYCGAVIGESDWRFCANCGASIIAPNTANQIDNDNMPREKDSIGNCMVCGLAIHSSEQVAYCIHCGNAAHRLHLLEWIHVKGRCPMCEQRLNEKCLSLAVP